MPLNPFFGFGWNVGLGDRILAHSTGLKGRFPGRDVRMRFAMTLTALAFLVTACLDRTSTGPRETLRLPFPDGVEGLPEAAPTRIIEAKDGDTVRMTVAWAAKWISGRKVRMLAYDGSIPGPTIKVAEGARITLLLTNSTSVPTSLHSHGVRLDYMQDGAPGLSQPPIDSGQTFAYSIRFPDPGVFWYHPHIREDYGMELGLYGNYLVVPKDPAYWPPVHREVMLMLDDILLEGNVIRPFYRNQVDYALMGRFGNAFLVNGDTAFTMKVKHGEVIRFFATNAASARVFNLEFSPLKWFSVVGADNGRYEYTTLRETDIIAPSERLVFQVLFKKEVRDGDTLRLYHTFSKRGVWMRNLLAVFIYDGDTVSTNLDSSMDPARSARVAEDIEAFRPSFEKAPDKALVLTGTMDMTGLMKKAHDPDNTSALGIEWFDEMGLMSTGSHDRNTRWILRDDQTGQENHAIDWVFRKGDKVLIRIYNDPLAVHAMPHPIHFHGQRFLVVREQGKLQKDNLVWRDSYLIGLGFTVEILLDASNPGEWMMHCHIPEHLGAQMMGHFKVLEDAPPAKTPYPWSLDIKLDSNTATVDDDTALTGRAIGEISGRVNGFNPAIIAPALTFSNIYDPTRVVTTALDGQGNFRFPAANLLGAAMGPMTLHISPRLVNVDYRPVPHKIRLSLNRAAAHPWSVDLDLSGEASFTALRTDTSVVGSFSAEFSGKVNGFDPAILQDTVFFVNVQYPKESSVRAPLDPDGSFRFDPFDVLGGTDGIIFVNILVKSRSPGHAPSPALLKVDFERNIE